MINRFYVTDGPEIHNRAAPSSIPRAESRDLKLKTAPLDAIFCHVAERLKEISDRSASLHEQFFGILRRPLVSVFILLLSRRDSPHPLGAAT
jgi:hypothetical protein